ncbi:MAG: branched-chain amino acid ABC transporter permease [Rhizobiaceae bacterium]|nr:branched-chain amino acid ABC transporter permease [Rhizobiaceae bacterium]
MSMTSAAATPVAAPRRRPSPVVGDMIGIAVVLGVGIACYFLFPTNLSFLTSLVALALLALSLDLVTGYGGVATLGHAALFGAGAYGAGIACVSFGVTEPFTLLFIGLVCGALAGAISGAIILRAHGLPQLVLSIAVVQLAHEIANKASAWTGGSDGLAGIAAAPVFGLFAFDLWGRTAFLLGLGLLAVATLLLRILVRSPFGMLCQGIRQDPVRVKAMGSPVYPVLVKLYAISGAVAGLGGALAAISTQVVGLDSVSFTLSAETLVMLVLGGVGTLFGAIAGTFVFMWFEHVVSAADPFHWMTLVGALLIAIVLFAPRGLYGSLLDLYRRRRAP